MFLSVNMTKSLMGATATEARYLHSSKPVCRWQADGAFRKENTAAVKRKDQTSAQSRWSPYLSSDPLSSETLRPALLTPVTLSHLKHSDSHFKLSGNVQLDTAILQHPYGLPSLLLTAQSPQAHLHVVGMLRFMFFYINQPSLPTPFYSVLCLFISLWPIQLYFIL